MAKAGAGNSAHPLAWTSWTLHAGSPYASSTRSRPLPSALDLAFSFPVPGHPRYSPACGFMQAERSASSGEGWNRAPLLCSWAQEAGSLLPGCSFTDARSEAVSQLPLLGCMQQHLREPLLPSSLAGAPVRRCTGLCMCSAWAWQLPVGHQAPAPGCELRAHRRLAAGPRCSGLWLLVAGACAESSSDEGRGAPSRSRRFILALCCCKGLQEPSQKEGMNKAPAWLQGSKQEGGEAAEQAWRDALASGLSSPCPGAEQGCLSPSYPSHCWKAVAGAGDIPVVSPLLHRRIQAAQTLQVFMRGVSDQPPLTPRACSLHLLLVQRVPQPCPRLPGASPRTRALTGERRPRRWDTTLQTQGPVPPGPPGSHTAQGASQAAARALLQPSSLGRCLVGRRQPGRAVRESQGGRKRRQQSKQCSRANKGAPALLGPAQGSPRPG